MSVSAAQWPGAILATRRPVGDDARVLDVAIRFSRNSFLIPGMIVLMAAIGTPLGAMFGLPPALVAASFLLLGMGFSVLVERQQAGFVRRFVVAAEARLKNGIDSLQEDSFCQHLFLYAMTFAHSILSHRYSPLRWIAVARARNGLAGGAVRIAGKLDDLALPGTPLSVPFEPSPLTEQSELLLSHDGTVPTDAELLRERLGLVTHALGRSRTARVVLVFGLIAGAIGLFFVLGEAIRDLLQGRRPAIVSSVLFGFAAVAPIALVAFLSINWRQERWFVVPGAIVARTSSWWNQRSELAIFRRKESVLIQWLDAHQLAVGSADGRMSSTAATARMADLALRAWLSPLPPPPVERLSDLKTAAR